MSLKKIKKQTILSFLPIMTISFLLVFSCKNREINYITYYTKVNAIDSTYRMANNPQKAVKEYRKLFRKYQPKNQERIEEYATYIKLSDQYHINFGGQKSLYKLVSFLAPYQNEYQKYLPLFNKYGIDSLSVKKEIANWKNNLNKKLVDSFKIAMLRDQEGRPSDKENVEKNVKKNAQLLIWTFKNYGFPSIQKIGTMPMHTFLTHMNESKEYYPDIKNTLIKYVKSGECSPISYAMMVDNYNFNNNKKTVYGFDFSDLKDTIRINHNRDSIGLPSLKHYAKIKKDFMSQIKKK